MGWYTKTPTSPHGLVHENPNFSIKQLLGIVYTMGRNYSTGTLFLAFGSTIKLPEETNWYHAVQRLKSFEYDASLFASASRVANATGQLDKDVIPEPIAKSARTSSEPVLVSDEDVEGESDYEHLQSRENSYDIVKGLRNAFEKILGKEHLIDVHFIEPSSGYEYEIGALDPVVFFFHKDSVKIKEEILDPGCITHRVDLPILPNADSFASDLKRVFLVLGMEGVGEPGWQVHASNSCVPR